MVREQYGRSATLCPRTGSVELVRGPSVCDVDPQPGIWFLQIKLFNTEHYYVAVEYEANVNVKGKIRFKIQIVFLIKNLVLSSNLTKRYKFFPLIVAF